MGIFDGTLFSIDFSILLNNPRMYYIIIISHVRDDEFLQLFQGRAKNRIFNSQIVSYDVLTSAFDAIIVTSLRRQNI